MADVEQQLDSILAETVESGSENHLSAADVAEALEEIIAEYEEDYAEDPEALKSMAMWDLVAADADPSRDAQFLGIIIRRTEVLFASGRGKPADVRRFGDSDFRSKADKLIDELRRRFKLMSRTLVLPRSDVEAWIGS